MYKTRREYFRQFWSYVEMINIVLSLCAIAMYVYRLRETLKLTKRFEETHGDEYMKFQYVGECLCGQAPLPC